MEKVLHFLYDGKAFEIFSFPNTWIILKLALCYSGSWFAKWGVQTFLRETQVSHRVVE
jgi:hypothetical protein